MALLPEVYGHTVYKRVEYSGIYRVFSDVMNVLREAKCERERITTRLLERREDNYQLVKKIK